MRKYSTSKEIFNLLPYVLRNATSRSFDAVEDDLLCNWWLIFQLATVLSHSIKLVSITIRFLSARTCPSGFGFVFIYLYLRFSWSLCLPNHLWPLESTFQLFDSTFGPWTRHLAILLQKNFFRTRLHYFATLDRITWILMLAFFFKLGSIIARCLLGTWYPFLINSIPLFSYVRIYPQVLRHRASSPSSPALISKPP